MLHNPQFHHESVFPSIHMSGGLPNLQLDCKPESARYARDPFREVQQLKFHPQVTHPSPLHILQYSLMFTSSLLIYFNDSTLYTEISAPVDFLHCIFFHKTQNCHSILPSFYEKSSDLIGLLNVDIKSNNTALA